MAIGGLMGDINNVHAKFFEHEMHKKEIAEDLIKHYIPKDILELLDLKTLEIEKDSFVDDQYKEHFSDVLYKITFSGKEGYIYFLFDHKSYRVVNRDFCPTHYHILSPQFYRIIRPVIRHSICPRFLRIG